MESTVIMLFGGHSWPAPSDYDKYFKVLYRADYMMPPGRKDRERHIMLELKFLKCSAVRQANDEGN